MNNEKQVLIRVQALKKYFPIHRGFFQRHVGDVKAVDNISFEVFKGETLGLVGESGCGKTTVGRTILQVYPPTAGSVQLDGIELSNLTPAQLRPLRRRMQMVFQDPYASLNPRMSVGEIVAAPLKIHGLSSRMGTRERVIELLQLVGLNPSFINRYPHEFSGGQRQRIVIARALALNPDFIICDEPIAALDVSIQAQVVNLLKELQTKLGLTYLFVAHDLNMVRHISDRVAVMYLGKIVELTDKANLHSKPRHPYTKALLSAVPVADPDMESGREPATLKGEIPSPSNPPRGCRFHTRCPIAQPICVENEPEFREVASKHQVACHFAEV
jgi:oligopeptide transport system ATP-binding protein